MTEFCSYNGKVIYPTRHAAARALRLLSRRKPDGIKRHVYLCPHCRGFHFGRPNPLVVHPPKFKKELS